MNDIWTPLGLSPTPEQVEKITKYMEILRDWNTRMNLIAASTVAEMEVRHIQDSAQLIPLLPPGKGLGIVDVGTGAGLPGIVLAILLPQHTFTLVEKVGKKVAFLNHVCESLQLTNVTIWPKQASELHEKYDVVTCRAWAPLEVIIATTRPLLKRGGVWLLLKGEQAGEELSRLPNRKTMKVERFPSITNATGTILRLVP